MNTEKQQQNEDENLWKKLLSANAQHDIDESPRNMIILGQNESGKSSLLHRFLHQEFPEGESFASGMGLEYSYLEVDPNFESLTTSPTADSATNVLSCWILDDQEKNVARLARFALSSLSALENSIIVIVLDLSEPWKLLDELDLWMNFLRKHISAIATDNLSQWESLKLKLKQRMAQLYDPKKPNSTTNEENIELPNGLLTTNLGIPIIVVCNKSDRLEELGQKLSYKEAHFDLIQTTLRKYCFSIGAALFYVSAKRNTNCDALLDYVTHRLYGFEFKQKPQLERDSLLVPAGFDSLSKIQIDFESVQERLGQNATFEGLISVPTRLNPEQFDSIEQVVVFEDDQDFFQRHFQLNANQSTDKSASILENIRKSASNSNTPRKSEDLSVVKKKK